MFREMVTHGALAAVLLMPAAAYGIEPPAAAKAASVQVAQASSEWDKLVKAAQREGKVELILGGQMPRKLRTAVPAFTKKYGIKVNYQTGSSRRHSARIRAERKIGRYTVDVWIGGANTALSILLPNKMLAPIKDLLVDPEVKNPARWYQGKLHFTDPEGRYILTWGASPAYVIAINTNLVKPSDIKSYWDLLDPKWKGKIVARSPARRGAAGSSVPLLLHPKVGKKWFERWANEMDVTIVRDSRQAVEWLALGRFSIGMFGLGTPAEEMQSQGFPILAYLPHVLKEGETLSASAANIMAVDRPPNPNAQKLFINWALSKETQTLFIKTGKTSDSLRMDVPEDAVAPQYRIRLDRKYYVGFSDPNFINNQRKHLKTLRNIMKKARKKKKKK
ncbi:MAG: extracellular solute-binding protein [Alphaproteobacteria bacterium]|nr:extracellular solute-binding protein [Pseudomonadota bacterium]TDI66893.1 MAG: extracellular solute-binding protein [Alphaproteobacteria bacterium]